MKSLSIIVSVIGVLMAFLVLSTTYQQIFDQGTEAVDREACRNSVLLRNQASLEVFGGSPSENLDKITPLSCKTKDKDGEGLGKEQEVQKMADLMSQCWYMFAEGRVDDIFNTDANEQTCHVCYQYLPGNTFEGGDIIDYTKETTVNPADFRGVGSTNYIGDGVTLNQIERPGGGSTISLDSLQAPAIQDFVRDPGNHLSDEEESEIDGQLTRLLGQHDVFGNVIVADNIQDYSRGEIHTFMQRVNMSNGSSKRGFILSVSLADDQVRLDLGADLRTAVTERGIKQLLRPVQSSTMSSLGSGVQAMLSSLTERFDEDAKSVVQRGSYFSYLTRGGQTVFDVPNTVKEGTPYAIAYVSPSNDQEYTWVSRARLGFFDYYFTADDKETVTNNFITVSEFTEVADRCQVRA